MKIDEQIRQALNDEEAEFLASLDTEPALLIQVADTFRGRSRLLTALGVVVMLAFLALCVTSFVRMVHAENLRILLLWGAGFAFSLATMLAVKIWYWMELQRHSLKRELKRLELQMNALNQAVTGHQGEV